MDPAPITPERLTNLLVFECNSPHNLFWGLGSRFIIRKVDLICVEAVFQYNNDTYGHYSGAM